MIDLFNEYQTVEDIIPLLDDKGKQIDLICENTICIIKILIHPKDDESVLFTQDDATVVGLFVKIFKMTEAITDAYKKNQMELICIFYRILFEAYVKMRYLIKHGKEAQKEYRLVSYRNRLLLYQQNNEQPNSIGEVMSRKFIMDIDNEGFPTEEIEAAPKKAFGGKSIKQLMDEFEIEPLYLSQYSIFSDNIHTDWGETRQLFMDNINGHFVARLESVPCHFRMIVLIIRLALIASKKYLAWYDSFGPYSLNWILPYINELNRITTLLLDYYKSIYVESPDTYMTT